MIVHILLGFDDFPFWFHLLDRAGTAAKKSAWKENRFNNIAHYKFIDAFYLKDYLTLPSRTTTGRRSFLVQWAAVSTKNSDITVPPQSNVIR